LRVFVFREVTELLTVFVSQIAVRLADEQPA
jgi:hypothetical protein